MKRIVAFLVALSLLLCMLPAAFAADSDGSTTAETAANRLHSLGLMKGSGTNADGSPDFDLDGSFTREQAVVMLLRLLGKEEEAIAAGMDLPFTDVSTWAADCVAYAYHTGLVNGTSATTFHGKREISAKEYVTLVLRTLGYSSATDFVWSSPWALSDAIGLTDGEYSSATTSFLRGDMAIVSANALDASLADGSQTLLEQIVLTAHSPGRATKEEYVNRIMTNTQLAALKTAGLDTLQKEISTIGDAAKFLDQFTPNAFSGFDGEIRLDLDFVYPLHTSPEATTPQTYTAFAAWCLADDYDGIKYIICTATSGNDYLVFPGLVLPIETGYYIYSPQAGSTKANNLVLKTTEISSLDSLSETVSLGSNGTIQQIFLADAEQTDLRFAIIEDLVLASVSAGSAQTVYTITEAEKAELTEAGRQERIPYAWNQLQNNWNSYSMPASMAPTMTKEEVEALVGKDIDTVAAACKTLGDCLYYYALSGFTGSGGDLQTRDNSIGGGNLWWHYNYAPAATFAHNTGNCGASSGLTSYLLQGDYATVGMIGITFVEGAGGGHFINYLYDGSQYYVFDIVNLLAAFHQSGFCFSSGSTLKTAANNWVSISKNPVRLMWAYQSFDGDVPVGWDWGNSHISYLPAQYKDGGTILMETPSEGYVYQWVTISEDVQKQIDGIRNPVSSRPGSDVFIDTTGNYLMRALTDEQLAEIKYADLETLQAWISTVPDAVAFLDQFTPNSYSGFDNNVFRLDIEFLYDLHRRPEATFSQTYTAFAAWCLADDYDGIQYVICTGRVGNVYRVSPALVLPSRYGYLIYSPYENSSVLDSGDYRAIPTTQVRTLENLENALNINWMYPVPFQIFLADAEQLDLRFALNEETMWASVLSGSAKLVYTMSDETKAEFKEAERQERVQYAWNQLQNNWNSYGMPASMAPTMTKEEVEALVGKDIDTVAAACKTLGDCLYYYALSGFTGSGGDLQTRDNTIGGGNLWWHYNYAPAATFAHNTGNCGASSGLTSYLLQGDYATVGMLGMTFVEGAGGGHFINYLYDGSRYYVFDIVNLLAAFHQSGFCFSSGSTLKTAANNWVSISENPVRLMWAYQSFDGDVPVGWDWGNSHISYLPAQYKDGGTILMETPSEGYVYQWVTINPSVQEQIDRTRNPD